MGIRRFPLVINNGSEADARRVGKHSVSRGTDVVLFARNSRHRRLFSDLRFNIIIYIYNLVYTRAVSKVLRNSFWENGVCVRCLRIAGAGENNACTHVQGLAFSILTFEP